MRGKVYIFCMFYPLIKKYQNTFLETLFSPLEFTPLSVTQKRNYVLPLQSDYLIFWRKFKGLEEFSEKKRFAFEGLTPKTIKTFQLGPKNVTAGHTEKDYSVFGQLS